MKRRGRPRSQDKGCEITISVPKSVLGSVRDFCAVTGLSRSAFFTAAAASQILFLTAIVMKKKAAPDGETWEISYHRTSTTNTETTQDTLYFADSEIKKDR
jgi:adenine/guanine phosphoribosyltransferase-like PRPP-binding protein